MTSARRHKIAIDLPWETYTKIKARAAARGTSFSSMAAELVACGLLDYEDSEAHEAAQSQEQRP